METESMDEKIDFSISNCKEAWIWAKEYEAMIEKLYKIYLGEEKEES